MDDNFEKRLDDKMSMMLDQLSKMTLNMFEKFTSNALISMQNNNAQLVAAFSGKINDTEQKMEYIETSTNEMASRIDNINYDIKKISDKVDKQERVSELTTEQVDEVNRQIKARIYRLLCSASCADKSSDVIRKLYFKGFSIKIRNDMSRDLHVPSRAEKLKKIDYDRVLLYVDEWYPKDGIYGLMEKLDDTEFVKNTKIKLADTERKMREYGLV